MSLQQNQWANPSPAGLIALAVACFTFFAALTGKINHDAYFQMGLWLLGGWLVQMIVGLIDYRNGALTGGNVFLFFSAFFMLVGGMEHLFEYFAHLYHWPTQGLISGYAWIALTVGLISWTPAFLKEANKALSMIILFLDVAIVFVSLLKLGMIAGPTYAAIAGWFLLFSGIGGLYLAAAIIVNGAFGSEKIKIGTPFLK